MSKPYKVNLESVKDKTDILSSENYYFYDDFMTYIPNNTYHKLKLTKIYKTCSGLGLKESKEFVDKCFENLERYKISLI